MQVSLIITDDVILVWLRLKADPGVRPGHHQPLLLHLLTQDPGQLRLGVLIQLVTNLRNTIR